MSLLRYGAYKDSGVPSLGCIPAHWQPSCLKRVVALVESGVSVNAVDEPAGADAAGVLKTSCVYTGDFDPRENKAVVAEDLDRVACPVKAGTLIVSRMNTPTLVGASGLVQENAENLFLPDRLWQIHFSGALPKFVHYWTATASYRAQVQMASAGTSASMQNLSQDEFLRFVLPLPTHDEQAAVAAFLDRETAKIDALIAEQERLIALLAEKRQATISHAVTRGLDPNAPMKDSGVPWLGKVPAHWTVCTLRRVLKRIEQGWSPECFSRPAEANEWGVLKTGCVNGGIFSPSENKALPETLPSDEGIEVRDGDLLMSRASGSPSLVGSVAYVSEPPPRLMLSDKIFRLHLKPGMLSRFFAIAFSARYMRLQIEQAISGAEGLANNLPQSSLKGFTIAIPPETEQAVLIAMAERESLKLSKLADEARRAVSLLKERRSALIAAAVTGQIDVRSHTSK